MVRAFLLLFGVVWGTVICVMFFSFSLKAGKGTWLVTIPAILIVAALATGFAGHMLHLPHPLIPYQQQIVSSIRWIPLVLTPLLLLIKLYELCSKKRARAVSPRPPSV